MKKEKRNYKNEEKTIVGESNVNKKTGMNYSIKGGRVE